MMIQEQGYKEHGTHQERITSWQRILNLLDDEKVLSKQFIHLGKHYKIKAEWEDVLSFVDKIKDQHFTDQIFELDKKFPISVNKCKCKGQNPSAVFYDANGMCCSCGLKIKQ